jgi:hypothetical protein
MKKTIFLTLLMGCSALLFAQNDKTGRNNRQAPQNVQQSFQKDHPNAGNVSWQQGNGQWHARHMDPNSHHNVDTYYDRNGSRLATHREMDRKEMPHDFDQRVNQQYNARGNYNVTRIERPNQREVYKLRVTTRGKSKTIYADEHGNKVNYREHY